MAQDCTRLVGSDSGRHRVQNVVHDGRAQLQIKVGLNSLLGNRASDSFGVTALELASQKVAQPSLQQRNNATKEKHPNSKHGKPKANSWAFLNRPRVEPVVDQMFEVFALAYLN